MFGRSGGIIRFVLLLRCPFFPLPPMEVCALLDVSADVLPRGVTLADLVDGGLVGHVGDDEVFLVQVGAATLRNRRRRATLGAFYPLGMEYLALPETAP
jgi:hypothetical protein